MSATKAGGADAPLGGNLLELWGTDPTAGEADAFEQRALARARAADDRGDGSSITVYCRDEDWLGAGTAPRFLTLRVRPASADGSRSEADAGVIGDDDPLAADGQRRLGRYRLLETTHAGSWLEAAGLLYVRVDVDPAFLEPFLDWYVDEHVPAVLSAPGMLGARRLENAALRADGTAPEGEHRFCTLYDMEAVDVVGRPETLAASERGACPASLAPHRQAHNAAYQRCEGTSGS